jgi:Holliday junction resolvasome RuvABC endonuclease subunit
MEYVFISDEAQEQAKVACAHNENRVRAHIIGNGKAREHQVSRDVLEVVGLMLLQTLRCGTFNVTPGAGR